MSAPLLILKAGKASIYPQPVYKPCLVSRHGRHWTTRKARINGQPVSLWRTRPMGEWFYFEYLGVWFRVTVAQLAKKQAFSVLHDIRLGGQVGTPGKWAS